MTARLHPTPHSSVVPLSQNTAPVNEFRCLFTHDIRRKQKRWQDGYLKFHAFNNRVMVYDQARNFLGDTYWKEPNELQEGDELQLDKPVMVEVAEALGTTQTDLTQLLEKKKDCPPSHSNTTGPKSKTSQKPMPAPTIVPPRATPHLRHKSLNTLLGTPKGPIGKATPIESPFEARKKKDSLSTEVRPAKRQKKGPDHLVSTDSGPPPNLEPAPKTTVLSLPAAKNPKSSQNPRRPLLRHAPVVAADSETTEATPNHAPPSTPPAISKPPRIPKGKVPVPHVKALQTPKPPPPPPSSPPISASNRIVNIDYALQSILAGPIETESPISSNATETMEPHSAVSPPPRKTRVLRLTSGVKRGMLLCQTAPRRQDPPAPQRRSGTPVDVAHATSQNYKTTDKRTRNVADVIVVDRDEDEVIQGPNRPSEKREKDTLPSTKVNVKGNGRKQSPKLPSDAASDMEITHGIMDQQLVVTPSPPGLLEIMGPEPAPMQGAQMPKPTVTNNANSKRNRDFKDSAPSDKSPQVKRAKMAATAHMARTDSHQSINVQHPRHGPHDNNKGHEEARKAVTPTKDKTHNASTSISHKEKPLSLGGFRKKPKNAQALRSPDDLGSSLTRKESSTVLANATDSNGLDNDAILDDAQSISPNRNLPRSRSANDASIPSISEEWEEQNLPKPLSKTNDKGTGGAINASVESTKPKAGGLAALVKRTDPRRKFQRTKSLNDNASVPRMVELSILDLPPNDDMGAWSTEAFDLFEWRPPVAEGEDQGTGLLTDRRQT